MIFNEKFDNSLWLMVNSDKNNKDDIVAFVKNLPNELYQLIYSRLDEYKQYKEGKIDVLENSDNFCLTGNIFTFDRCKYSFVIDMIVNSLTINKFVLKGKKYEKVYGLSMCAESSYNNADIFGTQLIGHIWDNGLDIEYEMISTLLGKMIVYSDNIIFKKYKRINVNEIPSDINIDSLSSKKVFVKARKKGI